MEIYSAICMGVGLLLHGLFIFGLMKINSHSFKSYRNYLILYSICISAYAVAIAVCEISMVSSPQAFVMMSQGIIRGLVGVGIYLGIMSIVLMVLITLPVYRYTAIKRNWLYHHISSVHAIAPYCALTAMGGLLIYCMPAFFFKPDAVSAEIAAPLLKSKFGLTRDHGYMAMIGYYGSSFVERWKAYIGLLVCYGFMTSFFIIAIVTTALIRKEVVGRNRSKRRQFLEKRHLICLWSQTILIMVLDHIPRYIWLTLPLFSIESDTPNEYAKYATPLLPVASALSIVYTVPELYVHIMKARGRPVAPSMDQGTTNTIITMSEETSESIEYSLEDKFYACVEIIQAMPKSGPLNPTIAEKLKMYSLFKQVQRDAWKQLGDLDKNEAMEKYVAFLLEKIDFCAEHWNWDEMMAKYSDDYERMGPILRVKFRIIDRELIKEDGTRGVSRDRTFTNKRSISEEGQSSNPRKEKIPRGDFEIVETSKASEIQDGPIAEDRSLSRSSYTLSESPKQSRPSRRVSTLCAKIDGELRSINANLNAINNATESRHKAFMKIIKSSAIYIAVPSNLSWRSHFFLLIWPFIVHWAIKYYRWLSDGFIDFIREQSC